MIKSKEKKVLEKLGKLIYIACKDVDPRVVSPTKSTFVDILEGLDYLRILIKYLQFDIEAAQRENEYLRGLLKNGR